MTDIDKPFTVTPILPGIPFSSENITIRVENTPDGQEVYASVDDAPTHPVTGEKQVPLQATTILPPRSEDEEPRPVYNFVHPETYRGFGIAVHAQSGAFMGYFRVRLYAHPDKGVFGIPEEWLESENE